MIPNTTAIERAFQLAESGDYSTLSDIKKALKYEGYSTEQITGGVLLRQLRVVIQASQQAADSQVE